MTFKNPNEIHEKIIQGGSMDRLDYLNDLETVDLGYDRIRKNQERFKIKFVINSHIDYKDALRFMLPYSIQEIPNEDLMVVLGGGSKHNNDQTWNRVQVS